MTENVDCRFFDEISIIVTTPGKFSDDHQCNDILRALREYIADEKWRDTALLLMGLAHKKNGRFRISESYFKMAVASNPQNHKAYSYLYEVYLRCGLTGLSHQRIQRASFLNNAAHSTQLQKAAGILQFESAIHHELKKGSRIELTDVTFLIPVRIDSKDRIRNLDIVLDFMTSHLNTNIILCEDTTGDRPAYGIFSKYLSRVSGKYIEVVNNSEIMHRTKMLNTMAIEARTPVIVSYDTDVLLKTSQLASSRDAIRDGAADLVFPYNGVWINVDRDHIKTKYQDGQGSWLDPYEKGNEIAMDQAVGGAVFFQRDVYLASGGYNENFVSWGIEDIELLRRFNTLERRVSRSFGPIYHLDHERTLNSSQENPYYKSNSEEVALIMSLTKEEIKEKYAEGHFVRPFAEGASIKYF